MKYQALCKDFRFSSFSNRNSNRDSNPKVKLDTGNIVEDWPGDSDDDDDDD